MNGAQCRMARAALKWGVRDLARVANVSVQTITRLEAGEQLRDKTAAVIQGVFIDAGIQFLPDDGGGVGIRFSEPSGSGN